MELFKAVNSLHVVKRAAPVERRGSNRNSAVGNGRSSIVKKPKRRIRRVGQNNAAVAGPNPQEAERDPQDEFKEFMDNSKVLQHSSNKNPSHHSHRANLDEISNFN